MCITAVSDRHNPNIVNFVILLKGGISMSPFDIVDS